ncbi:unnamed protein product [Closterium sp. Naga37s-1]|nr:unnamed protein product [Closterium sp. Naga37s-1]
MADAIGYPVPGPAPAQAPAPTAPPPVQFNAVPMGSWTTGCFGCFEDINVCCCSFWCPCVAFGRIAEIVTDGNVDAQEACVIWCFVDACLLAACVYSFGFRTKLRAKYNLPGDTIKDFCLDWCCGFCSFSQQYRELQNRGWAVADGYKANIQRFQAGNNTAPEGQFMSK